MEQNKSTDDEVQSKEVFTGVNVYLVPGLFTIMGLYMIIGGALGALDMIESLDTRVESALVIVGFLGPFSYLMDWIIFSFMKSRLKIVLLPFLILLQLYIGFMVINQ